MSTFKNRHTGDLVTAFGVIHDSLAARPEYELVFDDRAGEQDTAPQPEVLDEPNPTDAEGSEPSDSQDPAPADDKVGAKTRSTK